jgi:hypothetical protein
MSKCQRCDFENEDGVEVCKKCGCPVVPIAVRILPMDPTEINGRTAQEVQSQVASRGGKMVTFTRTLRQGEINNKYLNLTDDSCTSHGPFYPPHKTRFVVIDHLGRRTAAEMHNGYQIWGTLSQWFAANSPQVGDKVDVAYDPAESEDGQPVLRLCLHPTTGASIL